MSLNIAVIMDPIDQITPHKDTSFALLLEAQSRGWQCSVIEQQDIWLQDGICWGHCHQVTLRDDKNDWYDTPDDFIRPLSEFDIVLIRKDPPFDMNYIYLTYLLELVQAQGVVVANHPASLRDANEKLFCSWFPQCCPPTVVSSIPEVIQDFVDQHQHTVIKPLDSMGGRGIFRLNADDDNRNVIIETSTHGSTTPVMVQHYIDAISEGDKRILLINGEPVPYGLARIPPEGEFHGNLRTGAKGIGFELSERDLWIAEQVGPQLKEMGLFFVGIDVIGSYLTEINVTSPTCAREISAEFDINICGQLLDVLEQHVVQAQAN